MPARLPDMPFGEACAAYPPATGTRTGASRHWRRGETVCERCRLAEIDYGERRRRKAGLPIRPVLADATDGMACSVVPSRTGTPTGYARHLAVGEEPCSDCADAERDRSKEKQRKRRRALGLPIRADMTNAIQGMACAVAPSATGTYAGAQRHRSRDEPLCEACAEAAQEYWRVEQRRRRRRNPERSKAINDNWRRNNPTVYRKVMRETQRRRRETKRNSSTLRLSNLALWEALASLYGCVSGFLQRFRS